MAYSQEVHLIYRNVLRDGTNEVFKEITAQRRSCIELSAQTRYNLIGKSSSLPLKALVRLADLLGKQIKIIVVDKD